MKDYAAALIAYAEILDVPADDDHYEDTWARGYNAAKRDIARKLRELVKNGGCW